MMGKIMSFFGLEDDSTVDDSKEFSNSNKREKSHNGKIINVHSQKNVKFILNQPDSYEDSQTLADHLSLRRSVIVSLRHLEPKEARRIVDFLSGCVYAIKGNIKKIDEGIFLFTPDNVDILGDIPEFSDLD